MTAEPPRIIWMLWFQGWGAAPENVRACRASWELRNPGWVVHALDRENLDQHLDPEIVARILAHPKPPEALSDQVRLELLHRHGGVWADATTICARPLDSWLPAAMPKGFFAFSRPGPDRMLSTWFLASAPENAIVQAWRTALWGYWMGRPERHNYFWVHQLFEEIYNVDARVRGMWQATPQISAVHPFHFGPESGTLKQPPPSDIDAILADPPAPVFKLTHKFSTPPGPGSLLARLVEFARNVPSASYALTEPL